MKTAIRRWRTIAILTIIPAISMFVGLILVNLRPTDPFAELPHPSRIVALYNVGDHIEWSSDNRTIATNSDDFWEQSITLWDTTTWRPRFKLPYTRSPINGLAFSPDGSVLAAASWYEPTELWDVSSQKRLAILTGQDRETLDIAFSPDGRFLAAGGYRQVTIWESQGWKLHATFKGVKGRVKEIRWSPDGKNLAAISEDGKVRVVTADAGSLVSELAPLDVFTATWSPRSDAIATGGLDKRIFTCDVRTGKALQEFQRQKSIVLDVKWSADGRTLASSSRDDSRFWRGLIPSTLLSPKAATILWNAQSGLQLSELTGLRDSATLAWHPSRDLVAAGSLGDGIVLWNAAGHSIVRFHAPNEVFESMKWSPNRKSIAATFYGGTMFVWPAP